MTFDDDLRACAELVQRGDADRFLAIMASPPEARAVLFPIFAMNVEVSRAPWVTAEPMIAEMRLQWWRDALREIAEGGPVRKHEVTTPLARILPPECAHALDQYIEARRWDIYKDPFDDEVAFDSHLAQSGASLLVAAVHALGAEPNQALRDLGWAAALANWLRAIPELEARGRIPLLDGTAQGVQALAQRGLDRLARARAARAQIAQAARPAVLLTWETGMILSRAAKDPHLVAQGGLHRSPARRKLSLMARSMGVMKPF